MGAYCISCLWLSTTILFTSGIIFSMLSPVWFENSNVTTFKPNTTSTSTKKYGTSRQQSNKYGTVSQKVNAIASFGLIRYCRISELDDVMVKCQFFSSLQDMPSIAWLITTIIFSIGIALFLISVLLSAFGICTSKHNSDKLRIALAYLQVIGVVFLVISVLMFPLGLDSKFARDVCGKDARMYLSGSCQVTWGYVLSIMAISLTVFCPVLAKYSTEMKEEENEYEFEYKSDVISISPSSNSKVMTTV